MTQHASYNNASGLPLFLSRSFPDPLYLSLSGHCVWPQSHRCYFCGFTVKCPDAPVNLTHDVIDDDESACRV